MPRPVTPEHRLPAPRLAGWRAYATSAAAVATIAALGAPLLGHLGLANIVMLFPLAVLFAAARLGRGPAVLATFLSVALFDFFFVPPRFTLAVSDLQYLLTFGVLLAVALITAELATKLRTQRDAAEHRERRTRALYEMAGELSGALTTEQIAEIATRYVRDAFGARATLLLPDAGGALPKGALSAPPEHLTERLTERVPGPPGDEGAGNADRMLYLPLQAPMHNRGLIAIELRNDGAALSAEQRQLLATFARLIAIALERVHYIAVAQQAEVDMASERLRNSLLAALSHDLRTPLTALVGLADALSLADPRLSALQAELTQAIREEALRTSALVHNLLDMARLQSGRVELRREWQPLEEVVGTALRALARPLAAHRVRLDLPADLPLLDIDAVLMERVFVNLLENAAKYTPPGSLIEIAARPLATVVEIVVADDGPGLPAGRERELFEKFSRGRSESSISGVGLGLAIVQAVVDTHGGRIRAEPRDGCGARFVIELPRGEPPALPEHFT
jgi:two-component system sensor histidine kinase KdpD